LNRYRPPNLPWIDERVATNWLMLYSPTPNTVWVNKRKFVLKAGAVLFDTLSILTTVKAHRPLGGVHLIETWSKGIEFKGGILGYVTEISNANPITLAKELRWLKPPINGKHPSNTLHLASYLSDSVDVNGKIYKLSHHSGDFYYDSIHLKDQLSLIKCRTGCTGYYMFDAYDNYGTYPFKNSDTLVGSGATTLGPEGTAFTQKIAVNDNPVGWYDLNDTASVSICRNTPVKLEVITGIYPLVKANWYINGKLIDTSGVINRQFTDTGWHWIKVVATRHQRQCMDTTTTETTLRRLYIYPDITYRLPQDTLMCRGEVLKLKQGALNQSYEFNYSLYDLPCHYCPNQSIQIQGKSTLSVYIYKPGCPIINDTMQINVRDSLSLQPLVPDTLCYGQLFNPPYKGSGGDSSKYTFAYHTNNTLLKVPFAVTKSFSYQVTLNDGCTILGDTLQAYQHVLPPLNLGESKSFDLCYGQTLNLPKTVSGGKGKNTTVAWSFNGRKLSDTLIVTSSGIAYGVAQDGCSTMDTVEWKLNVKPGPKAEFSFDITCSRTDTRFLFTGTKPSALSTAFHWDFNGESTSSLENPSKLFAIAGIKKVTLRVSSSNGCADTIIKLVEVKKQAKSDFTVSDVCETDTAIFTNKSLDAQAYTWKFGDGSKSNSESPRHIYPKEGITQTYNVTLVALINGGCSDSISKALTVHANPLSGFTYSDSKGKVAFKADQPANVSYKWTFGNGDSALTSSQNHSYTYAKFPALYTICLEVTNNAGCLSKTCKNVTITGALSAKDNPPGIKIYPNPNTGNFIVSLDKPQNHLSIVLYNAMGELITKIEGDASKTQYPLNLNLPEGIYLVMVINGEATALKKIMVGKD